MKNICQSQLERSKDEGRRRQWEREIREKDEEIERLKQELETTATDDDNDSGGEQGIVMNVVIQKRLTSRTLLIGWFLSHCMGI